MKKLCFALAVTAAALAFSSDGQAAASQWALCNDAGPGQCYVNQFGDKVWGSGVKVTKSYNTKATGTVTWNTDLCPSGVAIGIATFDGGYDAHCSSH